MMHRRTFLATIAAGLVGRRSEAAGTDRRLQSLGVQLYTVRDLLRRDFEGTLAKVAAIGYREVEFAGLFDRSPRAVKAMLDRNGLSAPSGHADFRLLGDEWPQTLEAAHV